jgi:tetratricopeptide (TPR) repeat protein
LDEALALFEQAVALKEEALGRHHPDVAISLTSESETLRELGQLPRALDLVNQSLDILSGQGEGFVYALNTKGEILLQLGRTDEARKVFELSSRTEQGDHVLADPMTGLGRVKLATGDPRGAIPFLERALRIRERADVDPAARAQTRFALARALWDGGGDRRRALALANTARDDYTSLHVSREFEQVDAWLAAHAMKRKQR